MIWHNDLQLYDSRVKQPVGVYRHLKLTSKYHFVVLKLMRLFHTENMPLQQSVLKLWDRWNP